PASAGIVGEARAFLSGRCRFEPLAPPPLGIFLPYNVRTPLKWRVTMLRRRLPVLVLLGALLNLAPWLPHGSAHGAEASLDPRPGTPLVIEAEKPDNPPGAFAARDNLFARTPGLHVPFGPYVSIQVNVDA